MRYRYRFLFLVLWTFLCLYLFHVIYGEAKDKAIDELNAQQMLHAKQAARGIESFFGHWMSFLTTASKGDHIITLDEVGKNLMGFILQSHEDEIRGISRVDESGRITHTIPYDSKAIGADISHQKHIRETMRTRKPVVSDVFTAVQGFDAIAIHVPVYRGEEYRGTLAVLLDFKGISRRFLEDIRVGKTGYAWMTSKEGIELYCPVPGHVGNSVFENCKDFPTILSMAKEMTQGNEGITTYLFDKIGEQKKETLKKHAVYLPIRIGDSFWSIVVASSEDEILASLESFKNKLFLVIAVLLLGSFLFSYYGMKAWGIVKEEKKRRTAEEALRQSEEKYRLVSENIPVVVYSASPDENSTNLFISGRIEGLTGYTGEAFIGDPTLFTRMLHPEDRDRVWKKIREHREKKIPLEVEYQIITRGGTVKWIRDMANPILNRHGEIERISGFMEDITARKRAEEEKAKLEAQLRQAQKMEAIGTLAGGIAHEFNNILGIILGNVELAMMDTPEWSHARANLEEIEKASFRARDVVKQLLSFSRKAEVTRKPIKPGPIVKESLKLVRASIPTAIEIRRNIQDDTHTIVADPTQLNQVLINLCTNASDAMQDKGGILEVTLRDVELKEPSGNLPAGKCVKLTVSDTGKGIPAEFLNRIFDPYFTTKEVGKGTGLGLAVVHGIVQGHEGAITVDSEPGKGSTFSVFFPAVEGEPTREAETQMVLPGGNERVLFIDDEASIVQMATAMLEHLGYEVVGMTDPVEAIELFRASPERFDLLITDTTMPKMSGDRVAQELLKIRPDVRIVICTGYSARIDEEKAKEIGIKAYMMKPLGLSTLAHTVRKVLDER